MKAEDEVQSVEPEVIEEARSIELRRPSIPTSINELAALEQNQGREIIRARAEILSTLRVASIRLTMPRDWTLYRMVDGGVETVTGFLDDAGCDRIKKLWGIQIQNISSAELIEDPDTKEFAYRITGDGRCAITGEEVADMEGIRYSTEHYATEKPEGIQRHVAVRKAARANLDGGITRELAGLKSVPVQELDKAWEGTWKKSELCNKGRGFGSKDSRLGAGDTKSGGIDQADIPTCHICNVKLVLRPAKGDRGAFWGCVNYAKHPKDKVFVDHAELLAQIAERKRQEGGAA